MALLVASSARAQAVPPSPPADDEDLEVPAAPKVTPAPAPPTATAAPAASAPATPAAPLPPAAVAPAPLPAPSADAARIAELERRLAALEERAASAERAAATPTPPREAPSHAPALTPSPFSWSVPVGFRVGGYIQADYLHSQASSDQLQQTGVPLNQNRFYLRRGRLRLDRGWQYAAATLELDANTVSTPTVGIRRAEASLLYEEPNGKGSPPVVMLTAGITDLPFGYELYESDRTAPFTERSTISGALFPTKQDAGVKLSGAYSILRYGFAVTNGEPVDSRGFPRDPNDAKDVTGRVGAVIPVTDSVEVTGGASFVQGKGFHPGKPATKGTLVWTDADGNGVADFDKNEVIGVRGSAASPSKNFTRWAYGLDLGIRLKTRLGETHLHGEVIAASNYDRALADPVDNGVDIRQFGGYLAFTQDLTEYGIVGFRVAVYDPNADVLESRHDKIEPKRQTIRTLSSLVGLRLPGRARLSFQYDFIHDYLGRDASGVPTDAKNNQYQLRLQVDL